jgi:fatty acid desaturase
MNPAPVSSRDSWENSSPDGFVFDSRRIRKEQLLRLSSVSGFISGLNIAAEWLLIALAIALCQHFWNPLLYLVTIAFIGARQHALLILMHDGAHYRIFRNRRANDWLSELCLAWPNFVTMRSYRQHHFAHHRYLNTDRDPDWTRKKDDPKWWFPKSWSELGRLFASELSGAGAVYNIRLARSLSAGDSALPRSFTIGRPAFYALALGVIVYYGAFEGFILYWVVPSATWLMLVLRVRSIAEHFAIARRADGCSSTRTTLPTIFDRIFVASKNIGYHLEHHLYPSVPFFRLPELHRLLMTDSQFVSSAHLTRGYIGVLQECHDLGK